ncbi:MAG TPA: hypothetical protein VN892_18025 [Solirubrobacteraceae bacterium]|nr:hypothetical protein [Solirubrobacteraceae bacterium]
MSGVEVVQVDEVTWTPGSPLHRPQVIERTYRNLHIRHLDIYSPGSKLRVGQDAVEALDHIQVSELFGDQRSLAATKQRRNGALGAEQTRLARSRSSPSRIAPTPTAHADRATDTRQSDEGEAATGQVLHGERLGEHNFQTDFRTVSIKSGTAWERSGSGSCALRDRTTEEQAHAAPLN